MKKILFYIKRLLVLVITINANAQVIEHKSNFAYPDFNAQKINFSIDGDGYAQLQISTAPYRPNAVVFYKDNMFVSYDNGGGAGSGILWYSGVSVSPFNVNTITPTILVTNQASTEVAVDKAGNVFVANFDGTVTKFIKNNSAPLYSSSNKLTAKFAYSALGGLTIHNASNTIWVSDIFNHKLAVCKLSDFGNYTTGIAPFVKIIQGISYTLNSLTYTTFKYPEGLAFRRDDYFNAYSPDLYIANNNDPAFGGSTNPTGTIVVIKATKIFDIINTINSTSNPSYTLSTTDFETINGAANSKFGGLIRDDLYTIDRIYVGNQGNNQFQKIDLSNNTFITTGYSMGVAAYPGNNLMGIIPPSLINMNYFTILNCSGPPGSYQYPVFHKGTPKTNTIYTTIENPVRGISNVVAIGDNLTGSGYYYKDDNYTFNRFIPISLEYDGGGNAGTRTVNINALVPSLSGSGCQKSVDIQEPVIFTWGSGSTILSGSFRFGVPSTGTITVPINVLSAGPAKFEVYMGFTGGISALLTTNLVMGQTSVIIPINYSGDEIAAFCDPDPTAGQIVVRSYQSQSYGTVNPYYDYQINIGFFVSAPSISVNSNTICEGSSITLSASGCTGTLDWYASTNGINGNYSNIGSSSAASYIYSPSSNSNHYKAKCSSECLGGGGVRGSDFSNPIEVTLNSKPVLDITSVAPITLHTGFLGEAYKVVHIAQSTDVTANCPEGSIVWENSSTNPIRSFTTSNAVTCSSNGYPFNYSVTCTNSNSCASTLNIAISTSVGINDDYTTPINTFISGNVTANDIGNFNQVSPNLLLLSSTGTTSTFQMPHGIIVFEKQNMFYALTGQFTYYPTTGFQGIDSFSYSTHDGLACNNNAATVTINVGSQCTTPPNPTSASASPTAINIGQSSTLSATGCPLGTTYKWLYANTSGVASLNATFTDFFYETTNYTVHCVAGSCESSGIPVTVTVGTNIPFSISPTKYFAICQPTATITAAGCSGTVNWYRDMNGSGATNQFLASGNTLTYTTDANWRQYIRATCTVGTETSPLSNYCTVQTGPEIDPVSYIVSPNTPFTLNASSCPSGTTYLWSTGETTQSVTKSTAAYTLYFVRCVNNTCQSADAIAYIYVGNIIANNDVYNLNIDTPFSGNFTSNDGALSPRSIHVDYYPIHGSVVWDNTGAFTYTPTSNYSGTDSFTYYLTNGVGGYSNYATVTLNILCPTALPLSSNNSPSDDFSSGVHKRQASSYNGTITATNKITGTATVNYLAKSIQLNAGFKADNGTVFKAEVGGCY